MNSIEKGYSQGEKEKEQHDPIHGNIYQLKLLMLFLYGGIENEYEFSLGAEIKEAKKFDDLMFEYTEKSGKKMLRLLQAKHRLDEEKNRITANSLLTDGDFSLIKYFFSYQALKLEKIFKKSTIKDVIIFTNINFNITDLVKEGISVEEIKEEDKILGINCQGNSKQFVRYKFCKSFISLLKPKLENYNITKLARTLADCILEKKPIQHHLQDSIFSKYHQTLAEEVINVKSKKFQAKFVTNANISSTTRDFRDTFDEELKKRTENKLTVENLNEAFSDESILNKKISLQLSKRFGQGDKLTEVWPQNAICDDDIDGFLNHLVYAVNQPNEEELGNIIKDKIGSGYNYITVQYLYDKMFQKVLKLLRREEGKRFLTDVEGKELLEVGKKEIFSYPLFQFEDQLNSFHGNIYFTERDTLHEFISSQHYTIWILYSSTPWLRSLNLYKELMTYSQNLKYLFVPLSYLQDNLDIICKFKETDLWIVICLLLEDADGGKIQNIVNSFRKNRTSTNQGTKRLIYITPNHHDLAHISTQNSDNDYEFYYSEGKFLNLDSNSHTFISEKEIIRFQGNIEKQSIKELLQLSDDLATFITEMKSINLEGEDFEILLRNPCVDIWKDRPRFSDLEASHYKPQTQLEEHQMEDAIETNRDDIFAFQGREDRIKSFLSQKRVLNKFKEVGTTSSENIPSFILLESDKSAEQFKKLCHMIDERYAKVESGIPVIHLLKMTANHWIWIQSYNRNIYVQRQLSNPNIVENNIVKLLVQHFSHIFIIISGTSKETLSKTLDISSQFLSEDITFISESHAEAKSRFYKERNDPCQRSIFWFTHNRENFHMEKIYCHPLLETSSEMFELFYSAEKHVSSEEDLLSSKQQVIVLTGEAGTGKSFTLAHIAEAVKNVNPSSLVIKIELQKFREILSSISYNDIPNIVDILLLFDVNVGKNSLAKKVLSYMLLHTDRVKIFWDGFDELSPKQQDNLLQLFKAIQEKTSTSMWITTRCEYQEKLEQELNVFAYTFSWINDNDQASILTQFWDTALKFSYECKEESFRKKIEKHAKRIMDYFDCALENVANLMCIPLVMRMMAEMGLESLEKIDSATNSDISANFSDDGNYLLIGDLYHAFAHKKYDIYLYEKLNVGSTLDAESLSALKMLYTSAYGNLAVRVICDRFDSPIDCILNKKELFSLSTLSKIGLVEGLEEPANFIHGSFVEYFAIERITNELKCNPDSSTTASELWEVLLNKILMCPSGRRFFDDKLARDNEIENLLTYSVQRYIVYSLVLEQSRSMDSVLWYAGLDGLKSTLNFFLKSAENFDSFKEISFNLFEDVIFSDYAHYILLIETILNYGKVLDSTRITEFIITDEYNLLYKASVENDSKTADILINCVQDSDKIVELITSSAFSENCGKTVLHVALENSNIEIIDICLEKLNDSQRSKVLNMRDLCNKLPSDYATGYIKGKLYSRYRKYVKIQLEPSEYILSIERRIPVVRVDPFKSTTHHIASCGTPQDR